MNVLMVCLGNICRSPLAEGILRKKVYQRGLDWNVDSCGTAGYHVGAAPDNRSIDIAHRHGIDISEQKCRQFTVADFEAFDLVLVMDSSNLNDVRALARTREHTEKVKLIMDFVFLGKTVSVPDPYYGGQDGFQKVYEMLDIACDEIIKKYT